jgi:ABC-type glutathione transport system ATPase component
LPNGFVVEVETDREMQQMVGPSQLSSGEQQILVLAYEVLFRPEPETLVLIDEPELSLHVLRQDSFVDDLTRMGSARNLQFMLATHFALTHRRSRGPEAVLGPRAVETYREEGSVSN